MLGKVTIRLCGVHMIKIRVPSTGFIPASNGSRVRTLRKRQPPHETMISVMVDVRLGLDKRENFDSRAG